MGYLTSNSKVMWKGNMFHHKPIYMTPNELESLYKQYSRVLIAFAKRFIGVEDAYDVVMDVFANVYENPNTIAKHRQISTYLHYCVKNRCIDLIRNHAFKDRNTHVLIPYLESEFYERHDDRIERKLAREKVREMFKSFPPQQRQVLELSVIDEYSREEIAIIMGISENSVRNHKAAAMKKLKVNRHLLMDQ